MKNEEKGTESLSAEKPKAKEEGKKESEGGEKKSAAKKGDKGLKLHEVRTRILDDGTVAHEHHYKDKNGMPHHQTHEYSSSDIKDVHDHMDEHVAPVMAGGDPQSAGDQGEGEDGGEQDDTAQGAAPQASPAAGAPENGE